MTQDETPLMRQWREVKARHPDALVFFRVGDFYELFFEDAEEGARLLNVTLTSRNNGSSRAPLAGVPVHALDTYLERLVSLGRRVAICEQVEDPAQAKGLVRREVTQTITPGTVLADALLDQRRNNFLVAIAGTPDSDGLVGVASTDLSTGELTARVVPRGRLADLLGQIEPAELLLPRAWEDAVPAGVACTYRSDWLFESAHGAETLTRHFGVLNLDGFGMGGEAESLRVGACGAAVAYLQETQPAVVACLRPPRVVHDGDQMPLDEMTRRNLELVEPLSGAGAGPTLVSVLDRALTPMGGRLLRRWILAPLTRVELIRERHDAVAELVAEAELRRALHAALEPIRDLERLAVKVGSARCSPRDLLGVGASLQRVPPLGAALAAVDSPLLCHHRAGLDPLAEVRDLVEAAISPEASAAVADGGYIRPGYHAELDELRGVREGAVEWIARMQARERERTGIGSLRVGFNKVFGYYLEVTRANVDRVPDDYQRKQTLANAERYVTPELKEWEEKVLGAEEGIAVLERGVFDEVRRTVAAGTPRLLSLAEHVATLDALASLAEVAVREEYARPEVDDGYTLEIHAGRHPVVETMMPREEFIPNDVRLDASRRIMILTGPNMAGKSTVLRQVGLIVLLAQIGSFVPARSARLGVVDRIFTRVGASDNLVRGQSTFMVEMNETAAILHAATERSLVLLDEIGRGTSTWDGLSVATAVTEFLHARTRAKTIFATHYHELTRLADRLDEVVNYRVEVREDGEHIVFLRSLVPGGADRSYGVEVARLAGLPSEVIGRARALLRELEDGAPPRQPATSDARRRDAESTQLALFAAPRHPVVDRLCALDPDNLTPLQALTLLAELAAEART